MSFAFTVYMKRKKMMIYGLYNFIFIITILAFLINCDNRNYSKELESEYSKYFLDINKNQYFIDSQLEQLDNSIGTEYLQRLYEILIENGKLINKRSLKYISESKYGISNILIKLMKYYSTGKENLNLCFLILTEFNKQGDYDYVNIIFAGIYKAYFKLVTDYHSELDATVLKKFILSLPELKIFILAAYKIMQVFKQKINYRVFWKTYNNISKANYKQMLKDPALLSYLTVKDINKFIESIECYYRLLELTY